MEQENINQFVKKALEHYDKQLFEYNEHINSNNIELSDSGITIKLKNNKTFYGNCQLLGIFDLRTHIWLWGWTLPFIRDEVLIDCKNLLDYGLKLSPDNQKDEHLFIKTLLLNSRIYVEEEIQLEINLAIYSYLLKDRCSFILPYKIYKNEDDDKATISYYIIKK